MLQRLYKALFWFGYAAVFFSSLIKIPGSLNETKIGVEGFNIRLDHLLHLEVYFLIVIYFLVGQWKGI